MSDKNKLVDNLIHNYESEEKSIVSQLFFEYGGHGTSIGSFRENIWKELFTNIIPKKFVVERSIFIIDSNGEVSNEVDLAIIDEMYTPFIFRKGQLKFIPIEAVAVAVECKSKSATIDGLKTWSESIKKLKTSREGIVRMANGVSTPKIKDDTSYAQTATRPILIYCHLGAKESKSHKFFDFILGANEENGKIEISLTNDSMTLSTLYTSLNHSHKQKESIKIADKTIFSGYDYELNKYKVCKDDKDISLLSFNFMLNQALMLINNPMLFPHMAYVDMFNKNNMKLQKECFKATVISPLFSHGANTSEPELRATEIKALMRHTFRIASSIEKSTDLYKKESELFGNTDSASPIAVQLKKGYLKSMDFQFLLHKPETEKSKKLCYPISSTFDIILRAKPNLEKENFEQYQNILKLSLLLGGIGQRNRRGRGAIILQEHLLKNKSDLVEFISTQLNIICKKSFCTTQDTIVRKNKVIAKRPTIEKVIIGEAIPQDNVTQFLTAIDHASHKTKLYHKKEAPSPMATGHIKPGRFASSLLITLTKTADGIFYPIYVFVTPIYNGENILEQKNTDRQPVKDDRIKFIDYIKKEYKE